MKFCWERLKSFRLKIWVVSTSFFGQISYRGPPHQVDFGKIDLIGEIIVKRVKIDGYEIEIEDGDLKKGYYKDYEGKEESFIIDEKLKRDFIERRRKEYSDEHKERKYIDAYLKDEYLVEIKISKNVMSPEDMMVKRENLIEIIREIWRLPSPQNRRVYMKIIDDYSVPEIARIENRDVSVIRRSIATGLKKVRDKIKKF